MENQLNEVKRMQQLAGILIENQSLDIILDKIYTSGINSLSKNEKNYLDDYSSGKIDLKDPYEEPIINIESARDFFFNVSPPEEFEEYFDEFVDKIENLYGREFLTKSEFKKLYYYLADLEEWDGNEFEENWNEWKD